MNELEFVLRLMGIQGFFKLNNKKEVQSTVS